MFSGAADHYRHHKFNGLDETERFWVTSTLRWDIHKKTKTDSLNVFSTALMQGGKVSPPVLAAGLWHRPASRSAIKY